MTEAMFAIAERIAGCLDEDRLPYAIGGALALTVLAMPRDTADVDLSVFASAEQLPRLLDSLERAGLMIDRADATKAQARIGMFTVRAGKTLVDVFVSDHPHFHEMERRRVRAAAPSGAALWFVSAEDLCVLKLLFGRPKDVPDLEHLFAATPALDIAYVRGWLQKMIEPGDRRFAILDDLERRFGAP